MATGQKRRILRTGSVTTHRFRRGTNERRAETFDIDRDPVVYDIVVDNVSVGLSQYVPKASRLGHRFGRFSRDDSDIVQRLHHLAVRIGDGPGFGTNHRPRDVECGLGRLHESPFDHVPGNSIGFVRPSIHRLVLREDGDAFFDGLCGCQHALYVGVRKRHARCSSIVSRISSNRSAGDRESSSRSTARDSRNRSTDSSSPTCVGVTARPRTEQDPHVDRMIGQRLSPPHESRYHPGPWAYLPLSGL